MIALIYRRRCERSTRETAVLLALLYDEAHTLVMNGTSNALKNEYEIKPRYVNYN